MKRGIYLFTILLCTGLIFLSACKKDEVPPVDDTQVIDPDPDSDPDPDPDPDDPIDGSTSTIEEINAAFTFNNSSFKMGTPPSNSNLGDLKISKDTINIWPGIKNRVSILNHTGITITGVLVHLPGADGYHDVEIETEESNDTLAIFYVDIDPMGLDLPYNGNILIKPTNDSGEVIDEFDPPIHGDTAFDPDGTSSSGNSGHSSCSPAYNKTLEWTYTIVNNAFSDAPNYPFYQSDYTVNGCCANGISYTTCFPGPDDETVDVTEQYARTDGERMEFFDDGTFSYELEKTFNDYWPEDTDFCSRSPGYKLRRPGIYTFGEYSVDETFSTDDTKVIIINSIEFTTAQLLETGFPPILKVNENFPEIGYTLGCRYYIETILINGLDILRVYENIEDFDLWYD